MIKLRKSESRGHNKIDWLESYHSLSFAEYYDPAYVQYRDLRVVNEDYIAPGMGFGKHPHKNMEILTLVLSGSLAHQDSMGNKFQIKPGDVQIMSAGSGVTHSEYNASSIEPVHLYQIWMLPSSQDLTPRYDQIKYDQDSTKWIELGAKEPSNGGVKIFQDITLSYTTIQPNETTTKQLHLDRYAWVQVLEGEALINGHLAKSGDAVLYSEETNITISANKLTKVIVFDLH